jgi:hypothetical protein
VLGLIITTDNFNCCYTDRGNKIGDDMASSLYEIVVLPDGEVVLQRSNEEGEPLIRISFSDEAKFFLDDMSVDIAKAMIDAGIEAVEQMNSEHFAADDDEAEDRVLH